MKRVLTALILAPLVLALVFLGPMWLITLVVAAVAMLAAWEFLALTEHRGAKPPRIAVLVAIAALFAGNSIYVGNFQWPDETLTLFGVLCIVLLVYCTFASPVERALADATASVFALFYLGLTLIPLPMLREATNGPSLLAFLFLTVWAGDTVAMYAGRMLRKAEDGAEPQSQQDVGRSDRIGGRGGRGGGNPAWTEFVPGAMELGEAVVCR